MEMATASTTSLTFVRSDGGSFTPSPDVLDSLRGQLRGALCAPGEPGYEQARSIWNAAIDKRPSAIEVAKLHDSHGLEACIERWNWLGPRTISSLVRAGRRQLERRQKT